jgi:hypothetical protein
VCAVVSAVALDFGRPQYSRRIREAEKPSAAAALIVDARFDGLSCFPYAIPDFVAAGALG